jgi:tRNA A37 threonylcarbamoyladenosine dehydratase
MGVCKLTCFDADVVDVHNVSNQAYGISDVGLLKADAFSNLVETANRRAAKHNWHEL